MVQGTGTQGRAKQSPHNRLGPDGVVQQAQSQPTGILKQLGDNPAPMDAAINGEMDDGDALHTRTSRR